MKVIEQKPNLNMNRHYICGKAGSGKTPLLISFYFQILKYNYTFHKIKILLKVIK